MLGRIVKAKTDLKPIPKRPIAVSSFVLSSMPQMPRTSASSNGFPKWLTRNPLSAK